MSDSAPEPDGPASGEPEAPAPAPGGPDFLTIGHSNRPLEEFLDLLHENRAEVVVDVRKRPDRRRTRSSTPMSSPRRLRISTSSRVVSTD